jgi:hypothetical protein
MSRRALGIMCAIAIIGAAIGVSNLSAAANDGTSDSRGDHDSADEVAFRLAPSTPAIAACFPKLKAQVEVDLETDQKGRDDFEIEASGLPPKTDFTVFLLETPGTPFGAAEYIGDFTTDKHGRGENTFKLIVAEAFASTLVDGARVRAELNHVGFWFADPAGDDGCFGAGQGAVTPFDGDNEAGVQVMNSANALPGAPLPPP